MPRTFTLNELVGCALRWSTSSLGGPRGSLPAEQQRQRAGEARSAGEDGEPDEFEPVAGSSDGDAGSTVGEGVGGAVATTTVVPGSVVPRIVVVVVVAGVVVVVVLVVVDVVGGGGGHSGIENVVLADRAGIAASKVSKS